MNEYNLEKASFQLEGLETAPFGEPHTGADFDMTLYVRQRSHQTQLRLTYNADLFSRKRMASLLRQYTNLLTQIVTDPDARILSYSLLHQPELHQLLPC